MNTKFMSKETNDKFYDLHKQIMDLVINFCKENNVTPEYVNFGADMLEPSINIGKWHPGTDSSLTFFDKDKTPILCSI